jgi:hypothetical protein
MGFVMISLRAFLFCPDPGTKKRSRIVLERSKVPSAPMILLDLFIRCLAQAYGAMDTSERRIASSTIADRAACGK